MEKIAQFIVNNCESTQIYAEGCNYEICEIVRGAKPNTVFEGQLTELIKYIADRYFFDAVISLLNQIHEYRKTY